MRLPEIEFEEDYIPEPELSFIERWKLRRKLKKNTISDDYISEPKLSWKEKWNLWREKRRNQRETVEEEMLEVPTKKDLVIQGVFIGLPILLTVLSATAALCYTTVIMPLLFKILTVSLFVASTWIWESVFTKAIKEFKEMKKSYNENKDNTQEKIKDNQNKNEKTKNKTNIFTKLKNKFKKSKAESEVVETKKTDNKQEKATSEVEEKKKNNSKKLPNIKLNRLTKSVKIKDWKIQRVKGLGIYYIAVPKEDKNAQRFISAEMKDKMPEEKIQTFETEKQKVFVLSQKPNNFR